MSGAGRVLKIVAVGDGSVGKTSLLLAYTQGSFDEEYIPTVFDSFAGNMDLEGKRYNFNLVDTAGQEGYDRCRVLCYNGANVFLVCFSVDNHKSLLNVRNTWVPEARKEIGNGVATVLVGTKCDLRDTASDTSKLIKISEGKKMAKSLHMSAYIECSARAMTGLNDVFIEAIRATDPTLKPKRCCVIL